MVLVRVLDIEPNRRIRIALGIGDDQSTVEWTFDSVLEVLTLVKFANTDCIGTSDQVVAKALDSKGGVSLVLAGAKAFSEHSIQLNLVNDHTPDAGVGT